MKKRLFIAAFVLCLCFVLLPLTVMAADTTAIVTTEDELTEALADESKTIVKLTRDIDITATLEINRAVSLDLNGYVLKNERESSQMEAIQINSSGDLTLRDSRANARSAIHYFTVDESGLWTLSTTVTENFVIGGVITNNTPERPVCLMVNNGNFTMEGGNIVGICARENIVQNRGRFTMNEGSIVGCKSFINGSVKNNGNFTMNGGSIVYCLASNGGGVFNEESAIFTMTGGVIKNCTAGIHGGGVYSNGIFTMKGGSIENCTARVGSGINIGRSAMYTDGGIVVGDVYVGQVVDISINQSDSATSTTVFYGTLTYVNESSISGHLVEFMDGERYAWEVIRDGGNAVKPVDPTKTGYRFDGWFKDGTAWQFATTTVSAPTVLSAKWSHIAHTGTASCNKVAECETCGEPFGTIDPNNHHALTKIKAVSPTYSKEGNIAYWYCADCDKCFSDENTTHEITREQTIIPTLIYVEPIGPYVPNFALSISDSDNGSVTADLDRAKNGDIVTITVTPANGYAMKALTVLDPLGREIPLTDKGNGRYSFTMPNSMVEIKASFAEIQQSTPVEPDETDKPITFNDLSRDAYYYDAVLWAVEQGITGGVGNGKFDPNGACTRAQIVTFLWRAAGCPEPKNMNSFDDVPSDAYYAKAVAWAIECGITSGVGNGKFDPNATCTRAQSVTFLYRALGSPAAAFGISFGDVPNEAYYAKAVAWAAECGVTGGTSAETFSPDSHCTRAQIVTFIWRAIAK